MALCPTCSVSIAAKQVLKTTDVLIFPDQGAEQCPACHSKLIPTTKSVLLSILVFLILTAGCIAMLRSGRLEAFSPGFFIGFATGLVLAFGGIWIATKLIRFHATEPASDFR